MADYYTNFSFILPLPDEAAQKYALDLAATAARVQSGDETPDKLPPPLAEMIEVWNFEVEPEGRDKRGLWLHSMNGGMDAACPFIQHLLQRFNPSGRIQFEWSFDCSQPRADAFGGGAAIITATEIKDMTTERWLRENAA